MGVGLSPSQCSLAVARRWYHAEEEEGPGYLHVTAQAFLSHTGQRVSVFFLPALRT